MYSFIICMSNPRMIISSIIIIIIVIIIVTSSSSSSSSSSSVLVKASKMSRFCVKYHTFKLPPKFRPQVVFISFTSEARGFYCNRHSCHILPFQPILWNNYFPPEPAKTAKRSPTFISEGGRWWQVWYNRYHIYY